MPLKFSNILVISRLKNHIIKGNANKQCRNDKKIVKSCCPYLHTLVSGSPIIQNGKLSLDFYDEELVNERLLELFDI